MDNPTFVNRTTDAPEPDYIAQANAQIKKNGTIDPKSPTYKNAIKQYNADLIKGSVERLEIPKGFCGYIDPNSGKFRVEPDNLESDLNSSTLYPDNITNPADVPDVPITPYPIDQCLAIGLPGSYEYTSGNCGNDDGDNACSGIAWFSGGGTATEGGTGALSQSVCGGGPGINSNTGLAASSPVAGVSNGSLPKDVWIIANKIGRSLYPISLGYVSYNISNKIGTLITYDLFFNVNDPDGHTGPGAFRQSGLRISVSWDTKQEEVKGTSYTKTWE